MNEPNNWFLQFVGRPENCRPGDDLVLRINGETPVVPTYHPDKALSPLQISFEKIAGTISAWPRMYFEWDGSFVWTGDEPKSWQVDGMIYDLNGSVQHIEWKGNCPAKQWQQFAVALEQTTESVLVHVIDHACFVILADFLAAQTGKS